jgi:heme exporter protein C
MHRFANPLRYQRIADAVLPWAGGLAVGLSVVGLYLALIEAPPDYQQGDAYRIMFVHVPAAWMALMVYAMMAVMSVIALVWRHPLAEVAARLTSVLFLFFLYLGYIALWQAIEEPQKASRAAAILALVGFINVPIIKFSVDWWNTLHQPSSILRAGGPTIDPSMLWPLLVMWLAFLCYFVAVHILRTRAELTARKIRNLRLSADPVA